MESTEREQVFLDEVYRKARVLEYDKREAEKVLRNSRLLARQRYAKLTGIAIVTVAVVLMIRYGEIDRGLCVLLSLLLIGAGITVEKTEFSWRPESGD